MVTKGANKEAQNNNRDTALIAAAIYGNGAVVKYLVDKGANIEAADRHGHTALIAAAINGHGAVVEYLLKAQADNYYT